MGAQVHRQLRGCAAAVRANLTTAKGRDTVSFQLAYGLVLQCVPICLTRFKSLFDHWTKGLFSTQDILARRMFVVRSRTGRP